MSKEKYVMPTIDRRPLNVIVYENLKKMIIGGEIEPESKLTEQEVAKSMNVSATPVREAFRRLASDGLVKIIPWKGVIVQSFSHNEIKDAYECREALESQAIRLATEYIDEEGIKLLKNLLNESEKCIGDDRFIEVNTEIHNLIIQYSKNKKIKEILNSFREIIYNHRNFSACNIERAQNIYNEHKEIIQAIENRDVELSDRLIRRHIKNGYEYIKNRK